MFSIYTVGLITLIYLGVLFAIAFYGNKKRAASPIVYSLALGIHCTSWAFFGTTTQASQFGWAFVPTYLGVIVVMLFAFPVICKIAKLCRQHNISSIADFIGMRYQHSHVIAGMITLICFIGVVPYIALQLDAITLMLNLMTKDSQSLTPSIGFYVVGLMALFAIIFGTRTLDLTEKHTGLMYTIAFESLAKLAGLVIVGVYVCYSLFDGVFDLFIQATEHESSIKILQSDFSIWVFVSHMLLGVCSMFCLPRQFHIAFIENNNENELLLARWLFPLFLVCMTIFVLPIALAGNILLDTSQFSTDSFALSIPVSMGNEWVSVTSYIGGLSGATSMVIVATLTMGIMVANSFVTPLWLSTQVSPHLKKNLAPSNILRIRQFTVILVLSIAYWYHLNISQSAPLVKSGFIALSLLAQIFPAIILGIYWRDATKLSALIGTLVGAACWVYFILYPSILSSYYFADILDDADLASGFYISFFSNAFVFVLISWMTIVIRKRNQSRGQVTRGVNATTLDDNLVSKRSNFQIPTTELLALINRVIPAQLAKAFSDRVSLSDAANLAYAEPAVLAHAERLLSSHVGNASARILLAAISINKKEDIKELTEWVEQASQNFQFNHELLQSSVAHIPQGISVISSDMSLIAWNQKYVELFNYPKNFLRVGMHLREILKFNASRGLLGKNDSSESINERIDRRIAYFLSGSAYKFMRDNQNGRVIEIAGSPLPGGGYVTTYNDISEYIHIQRQLEEAKVDLESRVEERTAELNTAKLEAEMANTSKTKFLAAAGHDLMQPFNAASLFASMLHQRLKNVEDRELTQGLVNALENADQLLSMLLDMTKLESGLFKPNLHAFSLNPLLKNLVNEYAVVAKQKELSIDYVETSVWVHSDRRLLNRIVQNLISNAVRYTESGRILVGVRRRKNERVEICVLDTGRGINDEQKALIFDEFKQLDNKGNNEGIGLGLTIVEKMSQLLNHDVRVQSIVNLGTQFSISLQRSQPGTAPKVEKDESANNQTFMQDKTILLIENEALIASAMTTLLANWGAEVHLAQDAISAQKYQALTTVDYIIADYHLNNGDNGIDVCKSIIEYRKNHALNKPILLLSTADRSQSIREQADVCDMIYLPKPLKPVALKRLLQKTKT
ncbi:MAG: Na+/proline symporter/signal transduction histidine kinase/CheY-like chemotaxis protein [Glaciecola sp.]